MFCRKFGDGEMVKTSGEIITEYEGEGESVELFCYWGGFLWRVWIGVA